MMRPPPGVVPAQYFSKSALHALRISEVRTCAKAAVENPVTTTSTAKPSLGMGAPIRCDRHFADECENATTVCRRSGLLFRHEDRNVQHQQYQPPPAEPVAMAA